MTETHTAEVDRLNMELEKTKKERKDAAEAHRAAKDETRRLHAALNDAAYTRVSLANINIKGIG